MKRFVVLGITAAVLGSMTLCGSSISSTKVEKISRIVRGEYGKVKSPMRPQKWQIYSNTNDPKIKNTIYATVKKQVVPFETKEKIVNISSKTRQAVNKKVAARFPYKTPEQITQGAIEEADRELEALLSWAAQLDPKKYDALLKTYLNQPNHPPRLLAVRRVK